MGHDDTDPLDKDLIALLSAYEEALDAGRTPDVASEPDLPPPLRERFRRAARSLRLLKAGRQVPDRGAGLTDLGRLLSAAGLPVPEGAATGPCGRFRVVRELGRGGFGVVYLANDPLLDRQVAVKVPRPEALFTPEARRRFLREARAAAGLSHPSIVPIHDSGETGTLCYLVSAYCPGGTLAAYLRGRTEPLPVRAAAAVVAVLADAVQHAHAHGILHRDIKPGNVLLGCGPDAVPAPGELAAVVRLADFGLAKFLEDEDSDLGRGNDAGPDQPAASTLTGPAPCWVRRSTWRPNRPRGRRTSSGPRRTFMPWGSFCMSC